MPWGEADIGVQRRSKMAERDYGGLGAALFDALDLVGHGGAAAEATVSPRMPPATSGSRMDASA